MLRNPKPSHPFAMSGFKADIRRAPRPSYVNTFPFSNVGVLK